MIVVISLLRLSSLMRLIEAHRGKQVPVFPGCHPVIGTGAALSPPLIAGVEFSVVGFELPPHGGNQRLFAVDQGSIQHARCSSGCPDVWGRVHEVRRALRRS